jgi:hypothetical protein
MGFGMRLLATMPPSAIGLFVFDSHAAPKSVIL